MSFVKLPTAEACKLKRVKFFTADMAFRMFQHRSSEVINGYNMKKKKYLELRSKGLTRMFNVGIHGTNNVKW